MIKRGLESTMTAADVLTAVSRVEIERKGRWKSFGRSLATLIVVIAVLVPAWLVCRAALPSAIAVPPQVPARIALSLEVGLTLATVVLGWRCRELVGSSRAPRVFVICSNILVALVAVAGAADLTEKVVMWSRVADATRYPVRLTIPALFWPHLVATCLALAGLMLLAVLSSPTFWWRRQESHLEYRWAGRRLPASWRRSAVSSIGRVRIDRWKSLLAQPTERRTVLPVDGTVICCSGGGIRSSSFCLGGLQELQRNGVYDRASAVVGVSGGGYIAAALHVLRWRNKSTDQPAWAPPDPPAFSPQSQEFRWLRRHTRYLFDSIKMATLAGMSIIFGMTVNLFWCAAALGGLSWWLGWLFTASGGLAYWDTKHAVGGHYQQGWAALGYLWVIMLAGCGAYALERAVARLHIIPVAVRELWRSVAVGLIWVGVALTALVIGFPRLLAGVHNFTAERGGYWAQVASSVGLLPRDLTDISVRQSTAASLLAVIAAILAVVRAGLAKVPGESASRGGAMLNRMSTLVKHILLPWAALALILLVTLVLAMSWVAWFVGTPTNLAHWHLVLWFGVIAAALKIFTDANWTSLHHFYRERLSYAFITERSNGSTQPLPYKRALRFSQSAPPPGAGPALIACAVANVSDVAYVPADRRATPFVFDAQRIGLTDRVFPASARQMPAATYEFAADPWYRDATIPAAMAMSGAAFSPLAGREHRRVAPYRLIMALANARLGVWLPNPLWADELLQVRRMIKLRKADALGAWQALPEQERCYLTEMTLKPRDRQWLAARLGPHPPEWFMAACESDVPTEGYARVSRLRWAGETIRWVLNQPGAYRLFKEGVGRTSVMDRRLYITDGGHYDNLGLVEALRRRPQTIFVLDASNDPANSFNALGEAMATARIDLDCELLIDPSPMETNTAGVARVAWVSGLARHADGATTEVHFAKAIRLARMSLDNQVYGRQHPEFPRTSTGDQFYGEFDFEAYRQLGVQATRGLLRSLGYPPVNDVAPADVDSAEGVPAGERLSDDELMNL